MEISGLRLMTLHVFLVVSQMLIALVKFVIYLIFQIFRTIYSQLDVSTIFVNSHQKFSSLKSSTQTQKITVNRKATDLITMLKLINVAAYRRHCL